MDEVHVMRKVVIDGSNTTGFQRTCIISLGGNLTVDGKIIPIQQISLEEDAGRKTGESKNSVTFALDRLGVPLVEIATGPVINTPNEAGKVALAIGQTLRATRRVKRGLGSIRQDLNVSIKNGALIEIKGVQELALVPKVIELEVQRQKTLLEIREELKNRNVKEFDLKEDFKDLTSLISSSQSKIIQSALKQGGIFQAVKLQGFSGLLRRELIPGVRLGIEMAKRAGFWGRVGGVFHSDELPAYGITQQEKDTISEHLKCGLNDAFVLIADARENTIDGLRAVIDRAKEAITGVPEETRTANPDATTTYMRPRPSAARMYPETDVPPVEITGERVHRVSENMPRMEEEITKEIESKYHLSPKQASQLVGSEYLPTFEGITKESPHLSPSFVATVLTESLRSLERDHVQVENLNDARLRQVFQLIAEGKTAKESAVEILKWMAERPIANANEAVEQLHLGMMSMEELAGIVSGIVASNQALVKEDGAKAIGKMMNLVMGEVRGKADPKLVNEILKDQIGQA